MKFNRVISLSLVAVLVIGLASACSFMSGSPGNSISGNGSDIVELPTEQVPLYMVPVASFVPAVPLVVMPVASGVLVEENKKAVIDYSNTADGYIMVKWINYTEKKLRIQLTGPSEVTYTYILNPDNEFTSIPLSDGNGSYTVKVYEQTEGDRYSLAASHTFDAKLIDEFAPFLRPNNKVRFNADSNIALKAAMLVTGKETTLDKIAAVYDFVITNFTYDVEFAEEIIAGHHKGYIPDPDAVLARKKGICFDYAAVMTGMLRSQGIPVKLVEGYAGDVRHAWIDVFTEETGWVDKVIFFDGENWILMDPTFASTAGSSSAAQAFVGDGNTYTVLFLY